LEWFSALFFAELEKKFFISENCRKKIQRCAVFSIFFLLLAQKKIVLNKEPFAKKLFHILIWLPRSAQILQLNDFNPPCARFDLKPFNSMLLLTPDFGRGTIQPKNVTASLPAGRQENRACFSFGSFLLHEQKKRRKKETSLTFHHQLHRYPNRFTNSGKYSCPDIRHKVLMVITTNTNLRLS